MNILSIFKQSLLIATISFSTITTSTAHDGTHAGPAVTPLMVKDLTDMPGKESLMITVDYKPGEIEVPHRHDAHCFLYVLDGSVIMGLKGGKEVTLKAGQTFYEGPEDIHTVGRNASKTKPAKFLVILLKNKGFEAVLPIK